MRRCGREAQSANEASAEQRRSAAARDEAKDAEEAAAVAQLHARMGELQVCASAVSACSPENAQRRYVCNDWGGCCKPLAGQACTSA